MRHYKEVLRPAEKVQVLDKKTCDLCGAEIKIARTNENDVIIQHRKGQVFPECGHGQTVSFDICPDCFENRIISWMISQGAKPFVEDWEY